MLSTSLCWSSAPNAGAGTSRISQRSGATWATCDFLMFCTPLNAKVSTDGLTNAPLLPKMLSSFPMIEPVTGKVEDSIFGEHRWTDERAVAAENAVLHFSGDRLDHRKGSSAAASA